MPCVLVVQNGPKAGPGRFADWLTEAGLTLDVAQAYTARQLPSRLEHEAMVVMGGGFMPDDDHRAPWLARTRALAEQALDEQIPYFGICLGGQMLAQVAGGTVQPEHGTPEIGSTPVKLRAEAAADPLFHALPETVPAVQRHVDAITELPPDATWLAESRDCPYQAFRTGDVAWGVQFHPEASAERVRSWPPERIAAHGFDPDEVYRRALVDEPYATPTWRRVAERFAETVLAKRQPSERSD